MVIGPEDHNIRIRITVQKQDLKLNGLNVALCHDSEKAKSADCLVSVTSCRHPGKLRSVCSKSTLSFADILMTLLTLCSGSTIRHSVTLDVVHCENTNARAVKTFCG